MSREDLTEDVLRQIADVLDPGRSSYLSVEVADRDKQIEELNTAYEEIAQQLKRCFQRTYRLTKQLRSTLPEEYQHGCGLEGMIQSLLTMLVSKQVKIDTLEEKLHSAVLRTDALENFVMDVEEMPERQQNMMRESGVMLDNLDDPVQKLAFTLYTNVVEMSAAASRLMDTD